MAPKTTTKNMPGEKTLYNLVREVIKVPKEDLARLEAAEQAVRDHVPGTGLSELNYKHNKFTALSCAVRHGLLDIATLIINQGNDLGVDINRKDGDNRSALDWAVKEGHFDFALDLFLTYNAAVPTEPKLLARAEGDLVVKALAAKRSAEAAKDAAIAAKVNATRAVDNDAKAEAVTAASAAASSAEKAAVAAEGIAKYICAINTSAKAVAGAVTAGATATIDAAALQAVQAAEDNAVRYAQNARASANAARAASMEASALTGNPSLPAPAPVAPAPVAPAPVAPAPASPVAPAPADYVADTEVIDQVLRDRCACVTQQVGQAPPRRDLMQRMRTVEGLLNAAVAAQNYGAVSSLGTQLEALQLESAQLPLTKEDYLALPARHARLVQDLQQRCAVLAAGVQTAALASLRAVLLALQLLDLSALVLPREGAIQLLLASAATDVTDLRRQGDELRAQIALAPQRKALMHKRIAQLQQQEDARRAGHFTQAALVGEGLEALQLESDALGLSEDDYLTLQGRYDEIVRRLVVMCNELLRAGRNDEVRSLDATLQALLALNVAAFVV